MVHICKCICRGKAFACLHIKLYARNFFLFSFYSFVQKKNIVISVNRIQIYCDKYIKLPPPAPPLVLSLNYDVQLGTYILRFGREIEHKNVVKFNRVSVRGYCWRFGYFIR